MKRNKVVTLIVMLFVSAVFAGCATPPSAELDAAKSALSAAEAAEAAMYADAQLTEAKQAMVAAEAELATQQGNFALTRKYETAKNLIAEAANKAAAAEQAAVVGKQELIKSAETAIAGLGESVGSMNGMLAHLKACPKKPKGFDADVLVIGTQIDALKAEIEPVQHAMTDGDYKGAVARAEAMNAQIATLTTDLQAASQKIGCPMPEAMVAAVEPSAPPAN